jgi:hypothetical protein
MAGNFQKQNPTTKRVLLRAPKSTVLIIDSVADLHQRRAGLGPKLVLLYFDRRLALFAPDNAPPRHQLQRHSRVQLGRPTDRHFHAAAGDQEFVSREQHPIAAHVDGFAGAAFFSIPFADDLEANFAFDRESVCGTPLFSYSICSHASSFAHGGLCSVLRLRQRGLADNRMWGLFWAVLQPFQLGTRRLALLAWICPASPN